MINLVFYFILLFFILDLNKKYKKERNNIVEKLSIYIYYAYFKPTYGYKFNSLVVFCIG